MRRLHIGGKIKAHGWEIFNAVASENVDHAGNAADLSRFDNCSFEVVYASHVLEHFDYNGELENTLKEWRRVLKPHGLLYISVPDLDILSELFVRKNLFTPDERFQVMRMIFGGHVNEYDYHYTGFNLEFLAYFLCKTGFVNIRRVKSFSFFKDTSELLFKGIPISLNVIAENI